MSTNLNVLKTIRLYYEHPYRRLYCRCWGCGKRRILGNWWEGYQMGDTPSYWGLFCADCIVLVITMILDRVHRRVKPAVTNAPDWLPEDGYDDEEDEEPHCP